MVHFSAQELRQSVGKALIVAGVLCLMMFGLYQTAQAPHDQSEATLLAFDETEQEGNTTDSFFSTSTNRIAIPSIGVDMEIINEPGITEDAAFERGAWLLPRTAEPSRETGNSVIAAHRFLRTDGPNTFFHLDKLSPGDDIIITWEGETITYRVDDSTVVPPTAVEILTPTEAPRLTLFTCTPVFTTENRLVITASPV